MKIEKGRLPLLQARIFVMKYLEAESLKSATAAFRKTPEGKYSVKMCKALNTLLDATK